MQSVSQPADNFDTAFVRVPTDHAGRPYGYVLTDAERAQLGMPVLWENPPFGGEDPPALDPVGLLTGVLGFTADEFVSIGHKVGANGEFLTAVMAVAAVSDYIAKVPDTANVFFGINPTRGPARKLAGRGGIKDVTRLACLVADLDVADGKCADLATAFAIIDDLAAIVDTRPSAITYSGTGLHAYWPLEDEDIEVEWWEAAALNNRWKKLLKTVAAQRGCEVDTVFDLARQLRVPGTHNNKAMTNGQPGPLVRTVADCGAPLTYGQIDERLNEFGIYAEDEDLAQRERVSDPDGWTFSEQTCGYVRKMIDGLPADGPPPGKGRHQWLLSQAVRLACAKRLGCISERDYRRVEELVDARLRELRAATGQDVPRYEVPLAFDAGIKTASTKTDVQARAELGGHVHDNKVREAGKAKGQKVKNSNSGTTTTDTEEHSGQLRMAFRLAKRFDGKLLHVYGIGWHYWDGKRWAFDDSGKAFNAVERVLRRAWIESLHDKRLRSDVMKCSSAAGISGVLKIAGALDQFAVTVRDLDADPYLLNVANGTFDLRMMELRAHDPADRITKICRGAYREDAESLTWDAVLGRVLPDDDVQGFLYRAIGLGLIGEVRVHILLVLTGTGANGKTTVDKAFRFALGDYAIAAEPELFTHRDGAHPTGQMDLRGLRWASVSETNQGVKLAEATVKRLTGGDTIRARRMRQDFVEFEPSHTAALIVNFLPRVSGDDDAVWRRIRVVPFNVVIPEEEQDDELEGKLQLEADGILSRAVNGWKDYRQRGLDAPDAVVAATNKYRLDNDTIGRFIAERCVTGVMVKGQTTTQLHSAYQQWCYENGFPPLGLQDFGAALDRRGHTIGRDGDGDKRVRRGIALK